MGNANAHRYIGGKRPDKYFREDVWPVQDELFSKLQLDEKRSIYLFRCFVKIDKDESQSVDVNECFDYFGGRRTRFTERVFLCRNYRKEGECVGLTFVDFAIALWNYCTFNYALMAQYVFEIFDPENEGVIEKADVETMYKMLYACDEHDEVCSVCS